MNESAASINESVAELGSNVRPTSKESRLFTVSRVRGKKKLKYYVGDVTSSFGHLWGMLHRRTLLQSDYPLPPKIAPAHGVYNFSFSRYVKRPTVLAHANTTVKWGFGLEVIWPVKYENEDYLFYPGVRVDILVDHNDLTAKLVDPEKLIKPGFDAELTDQLRNVLVSLGQAFNTGGVVYETLYQHLLSTPSTKPNQTAVQDNPSNQFKVDIILSTHPGQDEYYCITTHITHQGMFTQSVVDDTSPTVLTFTSTRGFNLSLPGSVFSYPSPQPLHLFITTPDAPESRIWFKESEKVKMLRYHEDFLHALNQWKLCDYQFIDLQKDPSKLQLPPQVITWE